jgi:thiamine biosynthesis lipoprotein
MDSDSIRSRFMRSCDRRSFIKACGAAGVGLVAGGVVQGVFNVIRLDGGLARVSLTRAAMGTFVTVNAIHESRTLAQEAVGRTFEEMERLIAVFSRFDSSSPVAMLNRDGALDGPPPELSSLARRAVGFSSLTGGAFDITVKPLTDLLQSTAKDGSGRLPDQASLAGALELVGSRHLTVTSRRLSFGRSGMEITLDGIAKGYIVDRMSETLLAHGVQNHLIDAGGDIFARGANREGKAWTVAVQDPSKRGKYPDVLALTGGAVATSGSYESYYNGDKTLHHIVDPTTGLSPAHSVSASVRARSVTEADALSTAIFVMGHPDGIAVADDYDGAGCLVIDRDGSQHRSPGWRSA